jgi:hypothetical protein
VSCGKDPSKELKPRDNVFKLVIFDKQDGSVPVKRLLLSQNSLRFDDMHSDGNDPVKLFRCNFKEYKDRIFRIGTDPVNELSFRKSSSSRNKLFRVEGRDPVKLFQPACRSYNPLEAEKSGRDP